MTPLCLNDSSLSPGLDLGVSMQIDDPKSSRFFPQRRIELEELEKSCTRCPYLSTPQCVAH